LGASGSGIDFEAPLVGAARAGFGSRDFAAREGDPTVLGAATAAASGRAPSAWTGAVEGQLMPVGLSEAALATTVASRGLVAPVPAKIDAAMTSGTEEADDLVLPGEDVARSMPGDDFRTALGGTESEIGAPVAAKG
jgi:hypothetical protein